MYISSSLLWYSSHHKTSMPIESINLFYWFFPQDTHIVSLYPKAHFCNSSSSLKPLYPPTSLPSEFEPHGACLETVGYNIFLYGNQVGSSRITFMWMNEWWTEWMMDWMNELIHEWWTEWINVWINEWMIEWMNAWMNDWMNECMNEWMNAWINQWMHESINEWLIDGMNEWMNEWMNEMNSQPFQLVNFLSTHGTMMG